MAWASTEVTKFVIGNHRLHVYDCVYSGTGYGGGQATTGATGATGPTRNDLGFAAVGDTAFAAFVQQAPQGVTGGFYPAATRMAAYDVQNQKLIVGCTAGTDISDTTYRVYAISKYQL